MWRKIAEREVDGVRVYHETPHDVSASVNGLCIPGNNYLGKHIRVTVEEEVSECCEKWRGNPVCLPPGRNPLHWFQAPAKFCPECGRKL